MANIIHVTQFHQKFGMLSHARPVHLTRRKLKERSECLHEELFEFDDACYRQDLADMADALVDLVYFALGTADMLGLPWNALWNDVHRANISKERGITKRGHLVDVIKPKGWVGPQTLAILKMAGYQPEIDSLEENHRDDACHLSQADNI